MADEAGQYTDDAEVPDRPNGPLRTPPDSLVRRIEQQIALSSGAPVYSFHGAPPLDPSPGCESHIHEALAGSHPGFLCIPSPCVAPGRESLSRPGVLSRMWTWIQENIVEPFIVCQAPDEED